MHASDGRPQLPRCGSSSMVWAGGKSGRVTKRGGHDHRLYSRSVSGRHFGQLVEARCDYIKRRDTPKIRLLLTPVGRLRESSKCPLRALRTITESQARVMRRCDPEIPALANGFRSVASSTRMQFGSNGIDERGRRLFAAGEVRCATAPWASRSRPLGYVAPYPRSSARGRHGGPAALRLPPALNLF
jgi:hypothetical protein